MEKSNAVFQAARQNTHTYIHTVQQTTLADSTVTSVR